jgi:hypothetical protein
MIGKWANLMSKKQVIKDEVDAEARYQKAIKAAEAAAEALAADEARSESDRKAAEVAAQGLRELDAARAYAATVPPEQVEKTFMQTLKEWASK